MATLLLQNPTLNTRTTKERSTGGPDDEGVEEAPPQHVTERSPEADAAVFEGLDDTNLRLRANDADYQSTPFEHGGPIGRMTDGTWTEDAAILKEQLAPQQLSKAVCGM